MQATGVSKLDGQGTDKEAVAQQLAAVHQQVEQVKGENEELRNFFQEALHVSSTSDACNIAEHWRAGFGKLQTQCRAARVLVLKSALTWRYSDATQHRLALS